MEVVGKNVLLCQNGKISQLPAPLLDLPQIGLCDIAPKERNGGRQTNRNSRPKTLLRTPPVTVTHVTFTLFTRENFPTFLHQNEDKLRHLGSQNHELLLSAAFLIGSKNLQKCGII